MPLYIKTLALFVAMVVGFRLMGKKAVGQMSSYDLAVVLIMSTVLSEPLVTKDLFTAIYGATLLAVFYIILSFAVLKWPLLRRLILSQPLTLITRGKLDEQSLSRAKLTVEEFLAATREKGYTGPHELEWAFLEPDGQISFLPKASARPVQPPDLKLAPANPVVPLKLVVDGKPQLPELTRVGQNEAWLLRFLAAHQVDLAHVLLLLLDQNGDAWIYRSQPVQLTLVPGVLQLDPALFDNPFPNLA